jgi:acyl-homoserine lactone acylase PvdQ
MRWLLLVAIAAGAASGAEKIEILRDEYGVPHIFASTARGAAYASGYAQASDRLDQLLRHLESGNRTQIAELSPPVRAVIEAFCAGVNAVSSKKIEAWMVAAYAATVVVRGNALLIPPDRTASHAAIAIIDPQENWADASYQMAISSGDYNWVGAAPVGLPFPLAGHGFVNTIAPEDLVPGGRLLDQAWAMQTGDHLIAPDSGPRSAQAARTIHAQLEFNGSTTIYDALRTAVSTEVYGAAAWQKRIAAADAQSPFARMLTGWSRRSDFNSAPALGFYLFKKALGADSSAVEPPDSLSDNRIRAALRSAQDRMETEFPYQATYGTLFRIAGQPASGGTLSDAGMATPRTIEFEKRDSTMAGVAGQSATQIVEFARPVPKSYMLIPQSGDPKRFAQGELQPTYFGDRKELEKHVRSRKVLLIAP